MRNIIYIFFLFLISCSVNRSEKEVDILERSQRSLANMAEEERASVNHLIDSLAAKPRLSQQDMSYLVAATVHGLYVNRQYRDLILYHDAVQDYFKDFDQDDSNVRNNLIDVGMIVNGAYQQLDMSDRAIKGYELLAKKLKGPDMADRLSVVYTNLSNLYNIKGDYQRCIDVQNKSLDINLKLTDTIGIIYNYNNLASTYMAMNDNEKAIEYRFLALHLATSPENAPIRNAIMRNLATTYMKIHEWSLARKYMEQVISYYEDNNITDELSLSYSKYADIMAHLGDNATAERYFKKAISTIDRCTPVQQQDILHTYLQFMKDGNPTERDGVSNVVDRLTALSDTIINDRTKGTINSTIDLYQTELERAEQKNIAARDKQRGRMYIAGGVILALVLAVGCLIWMLLRSRRKIDSLRGELEDSHTSVHRYEQNIDHYRAFLSKVGSDLEVLRSMLELRNTQKSRLELRRILADVLKEADTDREECIYVTETKFHRKLLEKYPSLTSRDLKLCSLVKQGYSSKEIAGIMCRETRSIDAARNRLRKKLDIPASVDLCIFLLGIDDGDD